MKWIEQDTKIKGTGGGIVYAKNKYFIVHQEPSGISYSEDLINWTDIELDSNKVRLQEIAYGNDVFVAVGHAGNEDGTYIYVSKDGINWELKKINTGNSFSNNVNSVRFINNRFIFMAGVYSYRIENDEIIRTKSEQYFFESRNGIDWTKYTRSIESSENLSMMDITYAKNLYVQVGESGSIFISKDLINWTRQSSNVNTKLVGISYGKGMFVVTGANGVILTSEDGKTWIKRESGTENYLIRSRYANGIYFAVGYNSTILTSINGIDWTKENVSGTDVMFGLLFANNKLIISCYYDSISHIIPIFYTNINREVSYSNDNSLYVFDKELNFLGVIDDFISLRWHRKFYEAGEADLVVSALSNNKKLLQIDNIIIRQNYTEAMIIDSREIIDDSDDIEIKVTGKFLSYLLHRRIIKNKLNYSGNYIDGYKYLLQNMTPLCQNFEIEPTSLDSDNVIYQCTYKNVYDYHVKMSKNSNIGFRIVPNIETKTFIYENYKGFDRTKNQSQNERYCFSKDNCTLTQPKLLETSVDKCNYVLVGGEGEDSERIITELVTPNTSGLDLYEKFVDAKSERKENLNEDEYINLLKEKGKEVLKDITKTIEFTGLSTDYKTKWDLGDIADMDLSEFGIDESQRIIEVEEAISDSEIKVYPVFGNPLEDKIDLNNE